MLNIYEFEGELKGLTPYDSLPLAYSLFLAPDADESLVDIAGRALGRWIAEQNGFTVEAIGYTPFNES